MAGEWFQRKVNCFECGSTATVLHHVVPKSRGGTKTVPLCGFCHGFAHHANRNMTTAALTKHALQKKKAAGFRTGQVPYGFRLADSNRLIADPKEQKILRLIFRMRDHGLALRHIAGFLTRWEVVSKRGNCRWSHSTIQRILSNGR